MTKQPTSLPEFLIKEYKRWKSKSFINNLDRFKKLSSLGQKPLSMVITCCDSRIHATSIFGANEGDFFIHRNIANLVPPYSLDSENYGTLAAIEYAIKVLKIKHLIILGHNNCGGIKSAHNLMSNKYNQKFEFIYKWVSIIAPAFDKIDNTKSEEKQITQLEKESIKNSVNNLLSFPFIKESIENKNLSIHALIHDIGSGELKCLNSYTNEFERL